MPFCKYCGSEHDADAVFCTECGKPIVKKAVPVAENVPQVTPPVATPEPVTETAQEITPPGAMPAPVSDPPAQAAPTASKPPKKKKSKKAVWIIGVAVACIAVIAAVLILFSQGVFKAKPQPFSEDTAAIEAADASVVTIFCYDHNGELAATGSGFIAFDGKTVVTNYHVMTSAYTCKISTNQDISYEVSKIMRYSEDQDIAILILSEDTGLTPLPLGDSTTVKKGETVVAIGSPLGIKNTVSTGVLSGRLMEDNMDVLQFTAPISSGSSGGALFDDHGNVIGITYATIIDGQNLNLAIPIELATILHARREQPQNVSHIYLEEHPYVTKLEQYKGIPEITIDELLKNPKVYDSKTVKVYGYVSSLYSHWYNPEWGKYSETFTPHERNLLYIASSSNVTGNGAADYDMHRSEKDGGTRHRSLEVLITDDGKFYLSEPVMPGDRICWIGEISYWEDSHENVFFHAFTNLAYSLD